MENSVDRKEIGKIPKYQKYLIFGGAGFIGSNIAIHLANHKKEITIIDDLSTGASQNLKGIDQLSDVKFIEANLLEYEKINEEIQNADFVFNFAAKVGVDLVLNNPSGVIVSNVLIAQKLAQLCCLFKKPLFMSSSSEIYGRKIRDSISEDEFSYIASPKLLRWSYSISKIAEEFIARDYKRQGLKVLIGRYFNVIGENQNKAYGFVVPKFIHQARNEQDITVYGDGKQRRAFCDIRDVVRGILSLVENFEKLAELEDVEYNIGRNIDISINELAEKIITKCKSKSKIKHIPIEELPEGFDEILKRVPNIDKIYKTTNWKPIITLEESLDHIMNNTKMK